MSIAQTLADGTAQLRAAGVADPARDARVLLADALGVAADRLVLMMPDPVPAAALDTWQVHLAARCRRQPVAQIIGWRAFCGRRFRVTPDVLDPRPDTETLVEQALKTPAKHILDIGTGTGCILLSLLAEQPQATGIGTDRSAAALKVAQGNADSLGITRAAFRETDWAAGVQDRFDLIVSNPPYITGAEMTELSPDVVHWEPHMALTPGPEGVESYRALIPQAAALLAPGGRMLLEIGPKQGQAVTDLVRLAGLEATGIVTDLDGRDRVVRAQKSL